MTGTHAFKYKGRSKTCLLVGAVVIATVYLILNPSSVGFGLSIALRIVMSFVALIICGQGLFELQGSLYSSREVGAREALKFPEGDEVDAFDFVLYVPARQEAEVLEHTLLGLIQQTHSRVLIVPIVYVDDHETLEAANAAYRQFKDRIAVLKFDPKDGPRNKPRKLNHALAWTSLQGMRLDLDNTIVGVFDAEDGVPTDLLRRVDRVFRESPDVSVVQGGVQLMNHDTSWYSRQNVMEYYVWFSSRMSFHAHLGFVPLGGNTVFVQYQVLREYGGWPETLTEDCSLGVMLTARGGLKVQAHYDPDFTTQEQTPHSIKGLFKQRVRWVQGFYVELRRRIWQELPTWRQRFLALYVLGMPLFQAFSAVYLFVAGASAIFMKAPMLLTLWLFLPLVPMFIQLAVKLYQLRAFGKEYERQITLRQYVSYLGWYVPYQMLLAAASVWALIREHRGISSWDKTAHSADHLSRLHPESVLDIVNG